MNQVSPDLKPGESIDRLGYHGLRIIQNPALFKFTMDAFLLAAFIDPKPVHKLLDLGSGGGVLPLLIAGQSEINAVYGIEIQPELVEMAKRSILLNGLEKKAFIELADLRQLPATIGNNSFDYVISNPPFFQVDKGMASENSYLAIAKFEICCTLKELAKAAAKSVKANGKVVVIYPTERVDDLIVTFGSCHLTPKRICFIHPKLNSKSNLVLLEARPGAKMGIEILPPIVVYEAKDTYTKTMEQIFHGESYRSIQGKR